MDPVYQVKFWNKMDTYGKVWILVEICSLFLQQNSKFMVDFGKLTLAKDGKSDLEFLMELLVFPPFNGFVLPAKKMIIPLKDVVNFFNLSMIV